MFKLSKAFSFSLFYAYKSYFFLRKTVFPNRSRFLLSLTVALAVGLVFSELKITSPVNLNFKENIIEDNQMEKPSDFNFKIAATREEKTDPALVLSDDALIEPGLPLDEDYPLTRTEIEEYIVQEGETLSSIADKFDISINSLLWENNLSLRSTLKLGQKLSILPVDGLSYKVKKNDTIEKIAKKFKVDSEKIIEFNNLADPSDIFVGDILVVPGAKPLPALKPKVAPKKSYPISELAQGQNCHRFVPGQCTWYVARKLCVPWTGHAKNWIGNAKKMGFEIGSEPRNGAIISLRETGWSARRYGHVAYVESFDENTVTFSEMNYLGSYKTSTRTFDRNDQKIIGYIYLE